jgi:hypothetical protein
MRLAKLPENQDKFVLDLFREIPSDGTWPEIDGHQYSSHQWDVTEPASVLERDNAIPALDPRSLCGGLLAAADAETASKDKARRG